MALLPQWSEKIRTNYISLPDEVDQLKGFLNTRLKEVHTIDKEIEDLRQRIAALDTERRSHMTVVQDCRALLSTARKLPPEILGKIFMASLQRYSEDHPSTRMGKHPEGTVSRVCRLWRELAIGLPSLWSVIDLWLPKHPIRNFQRRGYGMLEVGFPSEDEGPWRQRAESWVQSVRSIGDMFELYLMRSVDKPITVAFCAKVAYRPRMPDVENAVVQRLVSAIIRSRHRFESITFKFKIESDPSPFACLLVMDPQQVPLLRSAQLEVKPRDNPNVGGQGSQTFMFQGPRLTRMALLTRWYFVQSMQAGIRWDKLTELSLCTVNRRDIIPPDISSTMEILGKCPELVRCALEFRHNDFDTLPDDKRTELYPITLPHLRHSTVHGHGAHLFLTRALSLPSLEAISVLDVGYNPYNGEEEEIVDGIVPWALKYGKQLHHVAFEYGTLSLHQFELSIEELSGVVSLKLCGTVDYANVAPHEFVDDDTRSRWAPPARLSNDVLRMISPKFDGAGKEVIDSGFCPKLRRIECETGDLDDNESGFLDFVAARRMVDRVPQNGVSTLKEVVVRFNSPKGVDFEAELVRRGVDVSKFGLRVEYSSGGPAVNWA